jgi:hypothetical protein
VGPAPDESRRKIIQLRQFDLKFSFVASGTQGKDIENERDAINHTSFEQFCQVTLLRWRECVIKDHKLCRKRLAGRKNLVAFSRAHEMGRIRSITATGNQTHHLGTR